LFPTRSRNADLNPAEERRKDVDLFEYLFLDTYTSTALDYDARAAEPNSLHEIECIRAWTRPLADAAAEPVLLSGYLVQKEDGPAAFEGLALAAILRRVQLGGKRGYGFGRAALEGTPAATEQFYGARFCADGVLEWPAEKAAPFHIRRPTRNDPTHGNPEPYTGKEWREDLGKGAGQWIPAPEFCWAPGAVFDEPLRLKCGPHGIWEDEEESCDSHGDGPNSSTKA
jgi:hypothetical protein